MYPYPLNTIRIPSTPSLNLRTYPYYSLTGDISSPPTRISSTPTRISSPPTNIPSPPTRILSPPTRISSLEVHHRQVVFDRQPARILQQLVPVGVTVTRRARVITRVVHATCAHHLKVIAARSRLGTTPVVHVVVIPVTSAENRVTEVQYMSYTCTVRID